MLTMRPYLQNVFLNYFQNLFNINFSCHIFFSLNFPNREKQIHFIIYGILYGQIRDTFILVLTKY